MVISIGNAVEDRERDRGEQDYCFHLDKTELYNLGDDHCGLRSVFERSEHLVHSGLAAGCLEFISATKLRETNLAFEVSHCCNVVTTGTGYMPADSMHSIMRPAMQPARKVLARHECT